MLLDMAAVSMAAEWKLPDKDATHNSEWTVWPTRPPTFFWLETERKITMRFPFRLSGGGIVPSSDGKPRRSVTVEVYHDDCLTETSDKHIKVAKKDVFQSDLIVFIDVDQEEIEGSMHFTEKSETTAEIAFCQKVVYNFVDPTDGEEMPEYTLYAKVNLHLALSNEVVDGIKKWTPTEMSVS